MNEELILVKLDTKYCDYLRQFDNKVPYNFSKKENRPFVGVLFEVNNCKYFAPLSSPKEKHLRLKGKIDMLRIDNGKLGVINFNNMIPVIEDSFTIIDLNTKTKNVDEFKYYKLLNEQYFWLNRNKEKLFARADLLYYEYVSGTLNKYVASRCCNFKLLEEKCNLYNSELMEV